MNSVDLQDKGYRHGLVASQIEIDLPLQIRALRRQRGLSQQELAEVVGMKQSRLSVMERPGYGRYTLETLRRLAEAFDVALVVRFAPFSELVRLTEAFHPEAFTVPSFDDDHAEVPGQEPHIASGILSLAQGRVATSAIDASHGNARSWQPPSGAMAMQFAPTSRRAA